MTIRNLYLWTEAVTGAGETEPVVRLCVSAYRAIARRVGRSNVIVAQYDPTDAAWTEPLRVLGERMEMSVFLVDENRFLTPAKYLVRPELTPAELAAATLRKVASSVKSWGEATQEHANMSGNEPNSYYIDSAKRTASELLTAAAYIEQRDDYPADASTGGSTDESASYMVQGSEETGLDRLGEL